jgi:hypothetical protein
MRRQRPTSIVPDTRRCFHALTGRIQLDTKHGRRIRALLPGGTIQLASMTDTATSARFSPCRRIGRNCQVGVANTGRCPIVGPIREHNYWGSMRDRIAASATDELHSEYGERLPRLGVASTLNRRVRVRVPENLAVIRSGQDWTDCGGPELAQFRESVQPALLEGMNFLRDHPDDTGCCGLTLRRGDGSHRRLPEEDSAWVTS